MGKRRSDKQLCPCGSGKALGECCAPYINGDQSAPTAEALMRSRYTAYALHNEAYIQSTWHPSTRPQVRHMNNEAASKWTGLEIIDSTEDSVEFIARYKVQGKAHKMHEKSRFVYEDQRWYYIDGETRAST